MDFDMGPDDRLHGERVEIEMPGPGGVRRVSVTKRWLEEMIKQGKIAPADGEYVQVHILDLGGPVRASLGLSGPNDEYTVATWRIGQDVPKEMVERFRDPRTQAIYAVVQYDEGRARTLLMRYDLWLSTKHLTDPARRPRPAHVEEAMIDHRDQNSGHDAVERALAMPRIQAILGTAGRTESDLRELKDRLARSGVEDEMVPSALTNVELLAWFFSLPDTNRISFDDSLRLLNWARYSNPAGPIP